MRAFTPRQTLGARRAPMAEEVQLLRLVRAFTKLKDPRRRREIVELAEASVAAETKPIPVA
jgi:hypothetical protein